MAKLNLMPDPRYNKTDKCPLVIRISHKGIPKYLKTGFILNSKEWDEKRKQIKSSFPNSVRANSKVQRKMSLAQDVLSDHDAVLKELTADQITNQIIQRFEENDKEKLPPTHSLAPQSQKTFLKQYGEKIIARYKKANRFGMVGSFEDALVTFLKFYGNNNLLLTDIDETFLEDLEADYLGQGLKLNGLGTKLRAVRRIYNLAIKDKDTELNETHYPFGKSGYSIRTEKAKKRAINLEAIQAIRDLDYPINSTRWHHRNYFLFMFNMRGMNFIDLAFLPTDAIQGDRLKYKRTKTKRGNSVKEFNIKITEEAQYILDYYADPKNDKGLTFPIMRDVIDSADKEYIYKLYQNRLRNHNRRLAFIGEAVGLTENLTTYVARHTFATAGLHKGISKAQIGDMLGHTNYYTTEAYFDDFDKEVLDDAADQILG
ncbi:MAG: phage integrase SAM-like domain-containing protein [Candidatus Cyclobacteriaceae bacterium M2_1C_046]